MAILSVGALNAFLDNAGIYTIDAVGTSASGLGLGTLAGPWGSADAVQDMITTLQAITDIDVEAALAVTLQTLQNNTVGVTIAAGYLTNLLNALQRNLTEGGVYATLDAFLTYNNTGLGGPWAGLQAPEWKVLSAAWSAGQVATYLNLYYEILQGATFTNAMRKLVVSGAVQTAGASIDSALYAGAFPQLNVTAITGSDVVTVTGTARDPASPITPLTGKTWVATPTVTGRIDLAPGGGGTAAPTDSLILAVSSISVGASLTAGTMYVEGKRPAGRPLVG